MEQLGRTLQMWHKVKAELSSSYKQGFHLCEAGSIGESTGQEGSWRLLGAALRVDAE